MKKAIAVFALFLLFAVLCIYLFFPAHQTLTQSVRLYVPQITLQRMLMEQSRVQKQNGADEKAAGTKHAVWWQPDMYNGFILYVRYQSTTHNSIFRIMTVSKDTSFVHWNGVVHGGNTPWQRIQTWIAGRQIKAEAQKFLHSFRRWEQDEVVYGFKVAHEKVKDTAFIATRFTTTDYPATETIYTHIGLLEQYIATQKAEAVGYPMLHTKATGNGYNVMVALPVNRLLPRTGALEPKRMIMGNILSTQIKGGPARVEEGMRQLQNYVTDHGYTSPAISFASLITDRTKEQDSTRWITKLYYPIM